MKRQSPAQASGPALLVIEPLVETLMPRGSSPPAPVSRTIWSRLRHICSRTAAIAPLRDETGERSSLRCTRPYGSLAWETEDLGPCEVRGSNLSLLVVLSRATCNPCWRYRDQVPPLVAAPDRVTAPGGRAILEGRRTRVTDGLERRTVELYEQGLSTRAVAEDTGIARTTVLRILKDRGVVMRPKWYHG